MSTFLHQRPLYSPSLDSHELSPRSRRQKPPASLLSRGHTVLLPLLSLLIVIGVLFPYPSSRISFSSWSYEPKWRTYTLPDAAAYVAKNNTLIVCAVSQAYWPFLNNWLISIARQKQQDKVLVIAEDYATRDKVNERWPGHAVLVPPALEAVAAHKFGSQPGGYNVMYNDVDMVWLSDPFPYLEGKHDVYFTDDMAYVKPLDHSHDLPPPGKKGRTYICSCMIYLCPSYGAKLLMNKWIEELQAQPWSRAKKANDQPAFNWALNKTAGQLDMYLLPQRAFPTGGLYFKNKTWVEETKGMHVIIHNNYIIGFEKKIKRFQEYGLWLVDDYASESPLGRL